MLNAAHCAIHRVGDFCILYILLFKKVTKKEAVLLGQPLEGLSLKQFREKIKDKNYR
jgi:hypothetical protein